MTRPPRSPRTNAFSLSSFASSAVAWLTSGGGMQGARHGQQCLQPGATDMHVSQCSASLGMPGQEGAVARQAVRHWRIHFIRTALTYRLLSFVWRLIPLSVDRSLGSRRPLSGDVHP
ncbi:hypothetical protein BO94DRAFT_534070 [Aspergillus sclerotioniger CBS 115572]|uniref:Uncharacterized protein n=1 Tax=Aspergillus sclerotioniger CBS 115572 TaxID=1450535 RepID=A0A317WZ77_9EURO|nr:hypothetical protein BO94DRAFT_534070 [Aspergillus sclerotioniger CBS 115572]PWY90567.1 hypothetical protein BO94DRAFT_534070 [Aspergillus sclerotioniger CBS 115572]